MKILRRWTHCIDTKVGLQLHTTELLFTGGPPSSRYKARVLNIPASITSSPTRREAQSSATSHNKNKFSNGSIVDDKKKISGSSLSSSAKENIKAVVSSSNTGAKSNEISTGKDISPSKLSASKKHVDCGVLSNKSEDTEKKENVGLSISKRGSTGGSFKDSAESLLVTGKRSCTLKDVSVKDQYDFESDSKEDSSDEETEPLPVSSRSSLHYSSTSRSKHNLGKSSPVKSSISNSHVKSNSSTNNSNDKSSNTKTSIASPVKNNQVSTSPVYKNRSNIISSSSLSLNFNSNKKSPGSSPVKAEESHRGMADSNNKSNNKSKLEPPSSQDSNTKPHNSIVEDVQSSRVPQPLQSPKQSSPVRAEEKIRLQRQDHPSKGKAAILVSFKK